MHPWKHVFTAFTLLAALGAAACQSQGPNAPGGGGGPTPAPSESPLTPDSGQLTFDTGPAPFADPTTPEERETGRYASGTWVVSDGAYAQTAGASSQTLMLQRYTGTALGKPHGEAPSQYRATAEVQVYEASAADPMDMVGAPNGIWGFIPYYRDAQHFVLLMAAGREASVWLVDGLRPGDEWDAATYRKWHVYLPQELKAGDTLTWDAKVNAATHEIEISLDGVRRTSFRHPMISHEAPHSVALVSNANKVRYLSVTLEPLSQD